MEITQSEAVFKAQTASLKTIAKETPVSTAPVDVPLINQMDEPRLYNGCEVASLAMVLNYHGYETTKNELAAEVPRVPLTYEDGQKGNPNEGFVGDMENGPGLSVYHGPIHELAQKYAGDKAIDLTGKPVELLYHYISHGLPVWVINTVNFVPTTAFQTWNTPEGSMDISFDVHSAVVTGYDEHYVYVNNPYGQKNQKVGRENFEKAWEQMGSQAIVIVK
ncbi:C39 family peptidase [Lentibacillus juripiscarius]|uniref:C39 family peptidase n=1 Tax=Lentibacillus juripiscarius TaxID=257446 RepID=A0ABW5V878_9BACI